MAKKVDNINTTDTSALVKKDDHDTKLCEIENKINDPDHINKYITTQEFNKPTSENSAARLKKVNFVSKNDIADFVKKNLF